MDPMQAEALRRAQEMHSRHHPQSFSPNRDTPAERVKNPPPENTNQSETSTDSQSKVLPCTETAPALFEDKEKLLVLVLILLLLSENSADTSVILALLYLII